MDRNKWFSDAIKGKFHQRLGRKLENPQKKEVPLFAMRKLINRWQKNLRLKSTGSIGEQIKNLTTPIIEKTWCQQNRNKIEQFWQISLWKIWWRQNEANFKEIIPNQSIYTQLSFQIQLRNVSVIVQKEKLAIKNFNLRWKKFILILTIELKSPEKQRKTEVCQFPSIMSEKNVRSNSRKCIHLRAIKFFLVFAGQKHVVDTSRVTDK